MNLGNQLSLPQYLKYFFDSNIQAGSHLTYAGLSVMLQSQVTALLGEFEA